MYDAIRLAVVDDHTLFRKTLTGYLSNQPSFQVIFEASDLFDLLDKLKSNTIDILITDVFMPNSGGMEGLKAVRTEYPELKIVVLSMSSDLRLINELLDIGIYAYISKADEAEDLIEAIISANDNEIYHNRLLTEALYMHKQVNRRTGDGDSMVCLNDREKKVIQLLWQEMTNKDIAKEIFLSVRSIEKIRQDMKQKLGVKSIIGLLKYGLINNIIEPGEINLPEPIQLKTENVSMDLENK